MASRLFKAAPLLLIGLGGIGFWHWTLPSGQPQSAIGTPRAAERRHPIIGVAGSSGFPIPVETAASVEDEKFGETAAAAKPRHQAGKADDQVAVRKHLPFAKAAATEEVPGARFGGPTPVSSPSLTRPARSFTIPAALAERPLPVFIRLSGTVEESGVAEVGALLPSSGGIPSLPAPREQEILAEAERKFGDAMVMAPTQDASAPEYEDWWRAAQTRSEDYLRLTLGWDRFNTLTRAEMKDLSKPSPANLSPAGEMQSTAD